MMLGKALLAAGVAAGIIAPEKPALIIPKPAIIRASRLEKSPPIRLGMPITMGMLAPKGTVFRGEYRGVATVVGSSASVYTLSGVDIGAADSTRMIVLGLAAYNGATRSINAVKVNGVSASLIVKRDYSTEANTGITSFAGIWAIVYPSGSTASIDVECSGSFSSGGISIVTWAVYGKTTSTAIASDSQWRTSSNGTVTATLTTAVNDFAVFVGTNSVGAGMTPSSNWTERLDVKPTGVPYEVQAGDTTITTAGAAAYTSSNGRSFAGAAWRAG